jgi:hypothetical protein
MVRLLIIKLNGRSTYLFFADTISCACAVIGPGRRASRTQIGDTAGFLSWICRIFGRRLTPSVVPGLDWLRQDG